MSADRLKALREGWEPERPLEYWLAKPNLGVAERTVDGLDLVLPICHIGSQQSTPQDDFIGFEPAVARQYSGRDDLGEHERRAEYYRLELEMQARGRKEAEAAALANFKTDELTNKDREKHQEEEDKWKLEQLVQSTQARVAKSRAGLEEYNERIAERGPEEIEVMMNSKPYHPVYPHVRRKHVSEESLRYFRYQWEDHLHDRNSIVILHELTNGQLYELFRHSRKHKRMESRRGPESAEFPVLPTEILPFEGEEQPLVYRRTSRSQIPPIDDESLSRRRSLSIAYGRMSRSPTPPTNLIDDGGWIPLDSTAGEGETVMVTQSPPSEELAFESQRDSPLLDDASKLDNHGYTDAVVEPLVHYHRLEALEHDVVNCCLSKTFFRLLSTPIGNPPDTPNADLVQILTEVISKIISAYFLLQDSQFCADNFTIVVVDSTSEHGDLNIIPVGHDIMIALSAICDALMYTYCSSDRLIWNSQMDASASSTARHLESAAHSILEYLGLLTPNTDNERNKPCFQNIIELTVVLTIGLVSYAGSHASNYLNQSNLEDLQQYRSMWSSTGIIPGSLQSRIVFRQMPLACLGAFIGGPLWAFQVCRSGSSTSDLHQRDRRVVTSISSFADLWGPIQVTPCVDDPNSILAVHTERGIIVATEHQDPGQETVHCHWYPRTTELVRNYVPFPLSSTLLIGADSQSFATVDIERLAIHARCPKSVNKTNSILADIKAKVSLGTSEDRLLYDKTTITGGLNKIIVATAATDWKVIPGRLRKELLVHNFQGNNPDPHKLKARIAIEISLNTGNALRVPLWHIFKLQGIKNWVKTVLPDYLPQTATATTLDELSIESLSLEKTMSQESPVSFLNAFDAGFDDFIHHWQSDKVFRESAIHIIRRILEVLVYTGPIEGKSHAWNVGAEPDGLRIDPKRYPWVELLSNSKEEAALIVVSDRCICSRGATPTCERLGIKPVLWTSIVTHRPPTNVLHKRMERHEPQGSTQIQHAIQVHQTSSVRDSRKSHNLQEALQSCLNISFGPEALVQRVEPIRRVHGTQIVENPNLHSVSATLKQLDAADGRDPPSPSMILRLTILSVARTIKLSSSCQDISSRAEARSISATIHKESDGVAVLKSSCRLPFRPDYAIVSLQSSIHTVTSLLRNCYYYQEVTDGDDDCSREAVVVCIG